MMVKENTNRSNEDSKAVQQQAMMSATGRTSSQTMTAIHDSLYVVRQNSFLRATTARLLHFGSFVEGAHRRTDG